MKTVRFTVILILVMGVSACGGGGGGGGGSSPSSRDVVGNLKFVFDIISKFTDRYTIDGTQKSGEKTSDGTDIYIGDNADFPNIGLAIAAAYYPSQSKYIAVALTALSDINNNYVFTITDSGGLRGCFYLSISGDIGQCFALKDVSQRFPLNVWARTRLSEGEQGDRLFEMEELGKMRLNDGSRLNSNNDQFRELKDVLESRLFRRNLAPDLPARATP